MKNIVGLALVGLLIGFQAKAEGTEYLLSVKAKFPILSECGTQPSQILLALEGAPSDAVVPLKIHVQICAAMVGLVTRDGTLTHFPAHQIFSSPVGSTQVIHLESSDQAELNALLGEQVSPDVTVTHTSGASGDVFNLSIEKADGSPSASLGIVLSGPTTDAWPVKGFEGKLLGFGVDAQTSRVTPL